MTFSKSVKSMGGWFVDSFKRCSCSLLRDSNKAGVACHRPLLQWFVVLREASLIGWDFDLRNQNKRGKAKKTTAKPFPGIVPHFFRQFLPKRELISRRFSQWRKSEW